MSSCQVRSDQYYALMWTVRTFRSPISRSMAASISCSERLGTSGCSLAGAEVVASAAPSAGPDPKSVSKCASLQRSSPLCIALHTTYNLFKFSTPADHLLSENQHFQISSRGGQEIQTINCMDGCMDALHLKHSRWPIPPEMRPGSGSCG